MPKTKQFEAYDLNKLIMGYADPIKHINMFEMADVFYNHIKQAFHLLDEGRTLSIEVPDEGVLYHIRKETSSRFFIEATGEDKHEYEINGLQLVNWLFEKAPFISMVGYTNA